MIHFSLLSTLRIPTWYLLGIHPARQFTILMTLAGILILGLWLLAWWRRKK